MSNNNPHGHINQQPLNPSWNPLQIPSYIPRQPQLAHMSNERPMVRSPLTWHAPAPPTDSIYNFMSSNHKNLDHHINPLLSPYIRGSSSLDSMDLSLQSSRNSSSPLNKGSLNSGVFHQTQQLQHLQQQSLLHHQQSQLDAANNLASLHNFTSNATNSARIVHSQHSHAPQILTIVTQQQEHNSDPTNNSTATTSSVQNSKYFSTNSNTKKANNSSIYGHSDSKNVQSDMPNFISQHFIHEAELTISENHPKTSQLNQNVDIESKFVYKRGDQINKDYSNLTKKDSPLKSYQLQQQQLTDTHSQNNKDNEIQTLSTALSPILKQSSASNSIQNQMSIITSNPALQSNKGSVDCNQISIHHKNLDSLISKSYLKQQCHSDQSLSHLQQPNLHFSHSQFQNHHINLHRTPQQQLGDLHLSISSSCYTQSSLPQIEANMTQATENKNSEVLSDKLKITNLSISNAAACKPDNIKSTDVIRSNEESMDSNSNNSINSTRKCQKKKKDKIVEDPTDEFVKSDNSLSSQKQKEIQHVTQTHNTCSNSSISSNGSSSGNYNNNNDSKITTENSSDKLKESLQNSDKYTSHSNQVSTAPISAEYLLGDKLEKPYQSRNFENLLSNGQRSKMVENYSSLLLNMSPEKKEAIVKIVQTKIEENNQNSNNSNKCLKLTKNLNEPNNEHNVSSNGFIKSINESITLGDNAEVTSDTIKEINVPSIENISKEAATVERPSSAQSVSSNASSSSSSYCNSNNSQQIKNSKECDKKRTNNKSVRIKSVSVTKNIVENTHLKYLLVTSEKELKDEVLFDQSSKTCFEEVENKLEEMFAGIDDEPIVTSAEDNSSLPLPCEAEVNNDLSLTLQLSTPNGLLSYNTKKELKLSKSTTEKKTTTIDSDDLQKLDSLAATQIPPTKAAKKTTDSYFVKPATPPLISMNTNSEKTGQQLSPKRAPPRRRLSINLDPSNLRINISKEKKQTAKQQIFKKTDKNRKELIIQFDDEQPSTSKAAAAALAARTAAQALFSENKSTKYSKKDKICENSNNNLRKKNSQNTMKSKYNSTTSILGTSALPAKSNSFKYANIAKSSKIQNEDNVNSVEQKVKGPFILISTDSSINVINTISTEDLIEKLKNTSKPTSYPQERTNKRGLHSSTLSNKYDANTTDSSWVCVFCKHGPHQSGLGDLYGPYVVSTDCDEYQWAIGLPNVVDTNTAFANKRQRSDMVQSKAHNLPVVPVAMRQDLSQLAGGRGTTNKKKRKLTIESQIASVLDMAKSNCEIKSYDTFLGMNKIADDSYEVWLHEDCAVWAPNVLLIGARITGLDIAVWNSSLYQCFFCNKIGATLCCTQRECKTTAHVPCSRSNFWHLDESTLKVQCQSHR